MRWTSTGLSGLLRGHNSADGPAEDSTETSI